MKIKKIICVDDDQELLDTYREIFKSLGVEVFTALNGIECGCLLPSVKPDLIILDLTMPDMGGIRTLDHLSRSVQSNTYILVVSGNLHKEEVEILEEKNIPYLEKPINFEQLLEKINSMAIESLPFVKN